MTKNNVIVIATWISRVCQDVSPLPELLQGSILNFKNCRSQPITTYEEFSTTINLPLNII